MPAGAKAVIDSSYVDDLVISFNDEKEALETVSDAIRINAAAGFNLRNFVSNSKKLEATLNTPESTCVVKLCLERQQTTEKILGLFWNKEQDTLEFVFKFHRVPNDILTCQQVPTKRKMLAIIMSIFDPFGLLANHTITAKLLMRSVWKRKVDWDDQLPLDVADVWNTWWRKFQQIKDFSLPRCLSTLLFDAEDIQLHVFVDASSNAFAAVGYLRVSKNERVDVNLVAAKTRCAPLRGMTIPRLELQAAVLGVRLSQLICQGLGVPVNQVVFWSDSKTVIFWIRSSTAEYKQFVACRIAEVLATSSPCQWRWLSTDVNIADIATKADLSTNSVTNPEWSNGPKFLHENKTLWPPDITEYQQVDDNAEMLPQKVLHIAEGAIFEYECFSSYSKLKATVAWTLRFVRHCKTAMVLHAKDQNRTIIKQLRSINDITALKVLELKAAENFLIQQVQHESFAEDIRCLKEHKRLPKESGLYSLTPYIDSENLLRIGGRLDNATCLTLEARRPVILPRRHLVSHLIMRHYHIKRHHQNDLLVINEMRQRYWVPSTRTLLRNVKRNCNLCIFKSAKPKVPLMGQLPQDRLTPFLRPFSYAGVDYCGPFYVSIGRRREKRWIALFTCLSTRAIHLEVAVYLSTDAFMLCLRNFVNRRGMPIKLRSDNGTNFVGAKRELSENVNLFDVNKIQESLAREGIEWVFNCPADPSAGGCWERMVQCVKRLLTHSLKTEAPKLETFVSILIEAENIINARPLTNIPVEPNEPEPLTPNHFLCGGLNSTQTPHPYPGNICLRKQWLIAQNLKDRLWKRWVLEYLPQLINRPKWRESAEPLIPGQLVIILDHKLPRSQWQRGKVINVMKASDGQVRSAEIETAQGIIRRPASKLAALCFSESC